MVDFADAYPVGLVIDADNPFTLGTISLPNVEDVRAPIDVSATFAIGLDADTTGIELLLERKDPGAKNLVHYTFDWDVTAGAPPFLIGTVEGRETPGLTGLVEYRLAIVTIGATGDGTVFNCALHARYNYIPQATPNS